MTTDVTTAPVRWGRILGVLLVLGVVLELVSQVFVYFWVGRPFDSFAKYRFSPYGLVRNNPRLTLPGFEHSANGFRNRAVFQREKPPGTLRVLILGGSVAYSGLATEMLQDAERPDAEGLINRYLEDELRGDPALHGLRIEVINASVPFNRAFEMASAYLAEYAAWDADVVIVMGSGNNFVGPPPPAVSMTDRTYGMEAEHPWSWDFERLANQRSLLVLAEQGILVAEDGLASVALLRKFSSKLADMLVRLRNGFEPRDPSVQAPRLATFAEYDHYVDRVIGVMEAMTAIAQHDDQEIVFFWEYFLRHLRGIRSYSPAELRLLARLKRPTDALDASYNFHARDRVAAWCRERGLRLLDPMEIMKHDRTSIFIDYLHYTPDGNRVLGRFMYRELRELFHERAARIRAEAEDPPGASDLGRRDGE